jgi:ceramide glucosyltransferase
MVLRIRHSAFRITLLSHRLLALFVLDRLLKMAAVINFFGKPRPPVPERWPSVTLLQPVTRGADSLRAALEARSGLDYPAYIQHLLVCDASDAESQAACSRWIAHWPQLDARIIAVQSSGGIALKTVKLHAGLPCAEGEVVCCVDDDVILRPDALRTMLPYLYQPDAGAVFGLACYTGWSNLPSSLMSAFVNSNALLTYIPATYLTRPFTITGHLFAARRDILERLGGFEGLERSIADDHDLARRLRAAGLQAIQTPTIYDVENHLPTLRAYFAQMKRWFVFPRQSLMPSMTRGERLVALAGSAGNFIPAILAVIAAVSRREGTVRTLAISQAIVAAVYACCELFYLKRSTPLSRRWLVNLVGLVSPLQIVAALLSGDEIEWRGRKLRIKQGGLSEEVRAGE